MTCFSTGDRFTTPRAAAIIFLAIVLALTVIQKWVSKRFVYYV